MPIAVEKENDIHYAPPWDHGFDVSFVPSQSSYLGSYDYPPQSAEDVNPTLLEGGPFGTYYWTGPGQRVTQNLKVTTLRSSWIG